MPSGAGFFRKSPQRGDFLFLSGTDYAGHTSCVSNTLCLGGTLFGTDSTGGTNCVSVFVPNGRVFFTEIQRGVALCGAREFAAPAAGQKGRTTYGFPSSLNSCLSLRGHGEICRAETRKGTAKDFSSVSFSTVSQCQIPDCYTGGLLPAECGITVPHKFLTCCVGRHLRSSVVVNA